MVKCLWLSVIVCCWLMLVLMVKCLILVICICFFLCICYRLRWMFLIYCLVCLLIGKLNGSGMVFVYSLCVVLIVYGCGFVVRNLLLSVFLNCFLWWRCCFLVLCLMVRLWCGKRVVCSFLCCFSNVLVVRC